MTTTTPKKNHDEEVVEKLHEKKLHDEEVKHPVAPPLRSHSAHPPAAPPPVVTPLAQGPAGLASNRPARFRQVEVSPWGAQGAGHEPQKNTGAVVPLRIILPATQTVNAIEVVTVSGTVVFAVSKAGGVTGSTAAIPVFATNAAAITGGLAVGAFYRTGADPDTVCVVH